MTTDDQPQGEGETLPEVHMSRNYALLLKGLAGTRVVFTLAILSTFIAAVTLLVLGTLEAFKTVGAILGLSGQTITLAEVRQHFIEVVDMFLVATIMYVISIGIYQLFADSRLPVADWLKVRSASDLEQKLIGVLITVLGVESLGQVATWKGDSSILAFGLTTALLIFALGYFAVNHGKQHNSTEEQEDDD